MKERRRYSITMAAITAWQDAENTLKGSHANNATAAHDKLSVERPEHTKARSGVTVFPPAFAAAKRNRGLSRIKHKQSH